MYNNAFYLAASRADSIFRYLAPDGAMYTGDDKTIGWTCTQMRVSRLNIARAAQAQGDPWATEGRNIVPGWYLIHVNSDGSVNAHFYADNLAKAAWDFAQADEYYMNWTRRANADSSSL